MLAFLLFICLIIFSPAVIFGALLVPDAGEDTLLEYALNKTAAENQDLRLYVSNTTPAEGDTTVTYTEMSTQGYAEKNLVGTSWAVSTAAGTTTGSYAEQTWTFDGTGGDTSVYGYFVVNAVTHGLLWAELFSAGPYTISNNGDQIKLTPKITLA
jgi:hypothetical protein